MGRGCGGGNDGGSSPSSRNFSGSGLGDVVIGALQQ